MAQRKALSASLRWQVFARDGFRCRYCGAQAGEPGVTLHADHVVSVVDGGSNAMDNLVAACQRCNGGKHSRSLREVPGSQVAVANIWDEVVSLDAQAEALRACMKARDELRELVIEAICKAYSIERFNMSVNHLDQYMNLIKRYGGLQVFEWLCECSTRRVHLNDAIKYIYGIIRNLPEAS